MIQSQEHEWFPVVSTSSFFLFIFESFYSINSSFLHYRGLLCLSLTVNNYYMYQMNLKIKLITAFKLIIVLFDGYHIISKLWHMYKIICILNKQACILWLKWLSYFINPSLYHLVIVYFFLLFIISTLDL